MTRVTSDCARRARTNRSITGERVWNHPLRHVARAAVDRRTTADRPRLGAMASARPAGAAWSPAPALVYFEDASSSMNRSYMTPPGFHLPSVLDAAYAAWM